MSQKAKTAELEDMLKRCIGNDDLVRDIINNPNVAMALDKEYTQLVDSREALRAVVMKNGDGTVHLPVNVDRLVWNAKEHFQIKPNSKSDMHPQYVLEEVQKLMQSLQVVTGVAHQKEASIITQANDNSTWLFRIYLQ